MTGESTKAVPIVLYADLLKKDWETLPSDVQSALLGFLEQLQHHPDSPEILGRSESRGKYFAYPFHGDYVAYWTIKRRADSQPERIELLDVGKRRETHLDAEQESGSQGFVGQVVSSFQRLAAIAVFVLAHRALSTALAYAVPSTMKGALALVQDVIFGFFALIYVYLAGDMVNIFIGPLWRRVFLRRASKLSEEESGRTL